MAEKCGGVGKASDGKDIALRDDDRSPESNSRSRIILGQLGAHLAALGNTLTEASVAERVDAEICLQLSKEIAPFSTRPRGYEHVQPMSPGVSRPMSQQAEHIQPMSPGVDRPMSQQAGILPPAPDVCKEGSRMVERSCYGSSASSEAPERSCYGWESSASSEAPERSSMTNDAHQEEAQDIEDDDNVIRNTSSVANGMNASYVKGAGDGLEKLESATFNIVVTSVIMLNAIVFAMETDIQWDGWVHFEYSFAIFYVGELVYKFKVANLGLACRNKEFVLWTLFDFIVVCFAIFDLCVTMMHGSAHLGHAGLLKLVRLVRVCRLVRLLKFRMFKELRDMVTGVYTSLRVLAWAIVLLFFLIFILALSLRELVQEESNFYVKDNFGSTLFAMFTLFRCFTDGCSAEDGTPLQVHLYEAYGVLFGIVYILIFLFVTVGLFNLMIADILDNVAQSNAYRRVQTWEEIHHGIKTSLEEYVDNFLQQRQLSNVDLQVFKQMLGDPNFTKILDQMDFDMAITQNIFWVLDADIDGNLEGHEFARGMMRLRGPHDKSISVATLLRSDLSTRMLKDIQVQLQCHKRELHATRTALHTMGLDALPNIATQRHSRVVL